MKFFFFKKRVDNTKELIKKIKLLSIRRKSQLFQFYYAFMLELKDGGISLVDVGSKDFFSKNWRFMESRYKYILLKIYEWFLNDIDEFDQLFIELEILINSYEFTKWATIPWFRFLIIKSLHDSNITKIQFNQSKQELTCIIETQNAIDFIPFNNVIELKFQTQDYNPKNIDELIKCINNNPSIIFNITPYFEHGFLRIDLDYECFINSKEDYVLPELNFICENILIRNL